MEKQNTSNLSFKQLANQEIRKSALSIAEKWPENSTLAPEQYIFESKLKKAMETKTISQVEMVLRKIEKHEIQQIEEWREFNGS